MPPPPYAILRPLSGFNLPLPILIFLSWPRCPHLAPLPPSATSWPPSSSNLPPLSLAPTPDTPASRTTPRPPSGSDLLLLIFAIAHNAPWPSSRGFEAPRLRSLFLASMPHSMPLAPMQPCGTSGFDLLPLVSVPSCPCGSNQPMIFLESFRFLFGLALIQINQIKLGHDIFKIV